MSMLSAGVIDQVFKILSDRNVYPQSQPSNEQDIEREQAVNI